MQPNGQIASRRLAAFGGQIPDGGRCCANGVGDLGIGHAKALQLRNSLGPSIHGADPTVFRSPLSTAIRNGVPLQCGTMATNLTTIGDRIRHARDHGPARKVSRKDLAAAAGIAYSTLADVENNLSNNTTALHKVAKRLVEISGEWFAMSDNPAYKPRKLEESNGVRIEGRVRWVAGWVD